MTLFPHAMTLICSHSNAFISTIAKHVRTYILTLLEGGLKS